MSDRDLVIDLAMRFLGKPYLWGGDDPIEGFDCSGLIVELFKSVGLVGYSEDLTAEGLSWLNCVTGRERVFGDHIGNGVRRGDLVLWQSDSGKMTHIELALSNKLSIGASGGGSRTDDLADAIKQNAYIKVRPFYNRPDSRKVYVARIRYNDEN